MELDLLTAISPIDGRYRGKTDALAAYFSEFALIKYRVQVEVEYFITLCELPLPQLKGVDKGVFETLRNIYRNFSEADAGRIKDIESVTNHDVKAVEYFLKEEFDKLGVTGRKLCIVSDSNVAPLYAKHIEEQLLKTGNKVFTFVFEAGEANKNLDTVEDVYEFLIKNHFDRKDMLVALGGGVVGDLTGFTAATYLRGISFIQVPTSLLAQVDSSIGGKTGVDFRAYKNMVGAFYQPKLVYMNISVLKSLSDRLFNSGFGEIIKHGLIKDAAYYEWLRDNISNIKSRNSDALEQMIYVSCNIKREVVEKDPKEKGDRALLNYGHTLGHAIEKLMDFKLYHGECVTLGMIAALRISVNRGDIDEKAYNDAIDMFKLYDFPLNVTGITAEDVVKVSKSDKKMDAGKIKFILLKEIGNAYIDYDVTDEEMLAALKYVILCNR